MSVKQGLMRLGCTRNQDIGVSLKGKTAEQFVKALGRPIAISSLGANSLLQWRSGSFNIQSIAVVFDAAGRFVYVSNRYNV